MWSEIEPSLTGGPIELDDYRRAVNELLPVVNDAVMASRDRVQAMFLARRSDRFTPVPWPPVADVRPEVDTAELAGSYGISPPECVARHTGFP